MSSGDARTIEVVTYWAEQAVREGSELARSIIE
jgi:hypothetical protein